MLSFSTTLCHISSSYTTLSHVKNNFCFFCGLRIFVSHFSQFLLHLVNQNHSMRIVLVNIFTHVKICFCFSRLFLNFWNENQSMRMVLFFIYDLPIFFYYVFLFCSNTCLQTFLHSLLYSNFPHFPHSLNHVCYPKTHSLLTRTQPWEGKLEYRCKSCNNVHNVFIVFLGINWNFM